MMNTKLINEVVELTILESKYADIFVDSTEARVQAIDWYNHTDLTDVELLAAAVLAYGNFKLGIKIEDIEFFKEFYFCWLH